MDRSSGEYGERMNASRLKSTAAKTATRPLLMAESRIATIAAIAISMKCTI